MNHFITIAGPQSSGKTTAFNHLREKHKDWYFVEEINPYTIAGSDHPGGAYTDKELEIKITEVELAKIQAIRFDYSKVALIETGIFHSIYTQFFGGKKLADQYLEKYNQIYSDFNSFVIFIDTKPEVSFLRRKEKYLARIKKRGITEAKETNKVLKKYENIIYRLYPIWTRLYEKIDFPKITIKNSYKTKDEFLAEIDDTIKSLLSRRSP